MTKEKSKGTAQYVVEGAAIHARLSRAGVDSDGLTLPERVGKLVQQRDDARRQAATYAAHIEDMSGQIDKWRERALVARKAYHKQKRITERVRNRLQQIRDKLGLRW